MFYLDSNHCTTPELTYYLYCTVGYCTYVGTNVITIGLLDDTQYSQYSYGLTPGAYVQDLLTVPVCKSRDRMRKISRLFSLVVWICGLENLHTDVSMSLYSLVRTSSND